MRIVESSCALYHAAAASLTPEGATHLYNTINYAARLRDRHLSRTALSRYVHEAAAPEPALDRPAIHSYLARQKRIFARSAQLGRSHQRAGIYLLLVWPLAPLMGLWPSKVKIGFDAVRFGLMHPIEGMRQTAQWPRIASDTLQDAIDTKSLQPFAPLGWAIVMARVGEVVLGLGLADQLSPLDEQPIEPKGFLQEAEKRGLVGMVVEKPLLALATHAWSTNRRAVATGLLGAACCLSAALQVVRLPVFVLLAFNTLMCGAIGVALGVALDVMLSVFDVLSVLATQLSKLRGAMDASSSAQDNAIDLQTWASLQQPASGDLASSIDSIVSEQHTSANDADANKGMACPPAAARRKPKATWGNTTLSTKPILVEEQERKARIAAASLPVSRTSTPYTRSPERVREHALASGAPSTPGVQPTPPPIYIPMQGVADRPQVAASERPAHPAFSTAANAEQLHRTLRVMAQQQQGAGYAAGVTPPVSPRVPHAGVGPSRPRAQTSYFEQGSGQRHYNHASAETHGVPSSPLRPRAQPQATDMSVASEKKMLGRSTVIDTYTRQLSRQASWSSAYDEVP